MLRIKGIFVWLIALTMGLCALFYTQRQAEMRFAEHWHYAPRDYNVELPQKKLSENVGYNLTKPKPKWQTESRGYVFWSGCWSK